MQSKIMDNQGLEIPLSGFYLLLLSYYRNKADNTKGLGSNFKQDSKTKITSSQMRNQQCSESFNLESFSPNQPSLEDQTLNTCERLSFPWVQLFHKTSQQHVWLQKFSSSAVNHRPELFRGRCHIPPRHRLIVFISWESYITELHPPARTASLFSISLSNFLCFSM